MSGIISDIVFKLQEVILRPKKFWVLQKDKDEEQFELYFRYLLPLILVAAVTVFLGELVRSTHFYIGFAALKSLRELVLFSIYYFGAVFFTNELMKTFGGEKNIKLAGQLVAYSITPLILVSMVTGLFQFLYVLDVLGIYSFYIFWVGGKELLSLPEQKRDSYLLITILVNFFIFSFLSVMLSKLLTVYF